MSYIFKPTGGSDASDPAKGDRRAAPESTWRQYDFGMDCLIPAEDYALPKSLRKGSQDD
ncbi:hypothetical protein GCM10011360_30770 [Primorskyibacter flagellatus]|uniref:Uncharacterized protein n=1 Tax=Primorskyibacter flagellatus TaxID=1387277 RepID=A0A917ABS4_9RHOB|nr:hypothetical protein [Primorskyibacter flagellatus]GGE41124.1 hypothetical protein GCM10011360_30770 [Primorskyibacter flagellatus]